MIQFDLPKELIAQEPARPRDSARLLVYDRKKQTITDTIFRDLLTFVDPKTTFVLNNSKVENCRWLFPNKKLEVFVLSKLDTHTVRAMVRPGKRFRVDAKVQLSEDIEADVLSVDEDGCRTLRLNISHDDVRMTKFEHIPLPPYIRQNDELAGEYQTVYADPLGSKAAPTAGLHFTPALLDKISKQHTIAEVTLHVGLGTFASPTEEQIKLKKLHHESYAIRQNESEKILKAAHRTTVGTTSVRTLESFAAMKKLSGETDIFIQPGYHFRLTDALITNFHLPGTSLLMLAEAFVGNAEELQRIYDHAIKQQYRFYSFGDAMLIN